MSLERDRGEGDHSREGEVRRNLALAGMRSIFDHLMEGREGELPGPTEEPLSYGRAIIDKHSPEKDGTLTVKNQLRGDRYQEVQLDRTITHDTDGVHIADTLQTKSGARSGFTPEVSPAHVRLIEGVGRALNIDM